LINNLGGAHAPPGLAAALAEAARVGDCALAIATSLHCCSGGGACPESVERVSRKSEIFVASTAAPLKFTTDEQSRKAVRQAMRHVDLEGVGT
jgi:hypothetical protein